MIKSIAPLLQNGKFLILFTLASVDDGKVRLTVTPKRLASQGKGDDDDTDEDDLDDNTKALRLIDKPLVLTGTPEEIDGGLLETLTSYKDQRTGAEATLAALEAQITEALEQKKKALEEARKATADAKKQTADAKAGTPAKPAATAKPEQVEIELV